MPNIMLNHDTEAANRLIVGLARVLSPDLLNDIVISISLGPIWEPVIRVSDETSVFLFEKVYNACASAGIEVSTRRFQPILKPDMIDLEFFGYGHDQPWGDFSTRLPDAVNVCKVPSMVKDLVGKPSPFAAIYQSLTAKLDDLFIETAIKVNEIIETEVFWRGPERLMTFHEHGTFTDWLDKSF